MITSEPHKKLASDVAALVHLDDKLEAAVRIVRAFNLKTKLHIDSKAKDYLPILTFYLHELMNGGGMSEAAQILWSPNQFTPEPKSVRDVWELCDTSQTGIVMGAASLGKSFSFGVRFFLEWVKDPEYTSVRVIGPSEDHLEANLFSHLVSLHSEATLPMPGTVGELFIGMNRRNQLGSIRGIVIPKGNSKKAGRLQGGHRKPRPVPHPKFGPLSRMFILCDEAENIPQGIWHDIGNVLSEAKGGHGFGIFLVYNPSDRSAEIAKYAEPVFGYSALDEDTHFKWKSTRGWDVLRLDAEKSENVVQGKEIYPGLQTREGLEKMAVSAGGRQAAHYMTMGRGMYPSQGVEATVIPPGMLPKWIGEFIWLDNPIPVAADDLALDGGDAAIRTLGRWGLATGIKYPPTLDFPQGRKIMFRDPKGNVIARWGLQADRQFAMEKGDTVVMKDQVISLNKRGGIRGEFYACDRTGGGSGVADLVRNEWSTAIHDINYTEGCSKEKLMTEDSKTCDEQYVRMFTELWFALRYWGEFGYFLIAPTVDMTVLRDQLINRRYRSSGPKTQVESKVDYQSRGSVASPNEADSLTLLVYAARKGSGIIPSMKGDASMPESGWEDDWPGQTGPGGTKIDESNRSDFLREREEDGAEAAWSQVHGIH